MTDIIYIPMIPNEHKNSFQGIAHIILASTVFVIFNKNLILFEVLLNF